MKSIRQLLSLAKKEKKREKKSTHGSHSMEWESPPSYNEIKSPSAPIFGYDYEDMEYLPTLGVQTLKLQYKCVLQVRSESPFTSYLDAVDNVANWEKQYNGFSGKKPFYRAVMVRAVQAMKANPMSLQDGRSPEYTSEIEGRCLVFHSLGHIPPMMYVCEQFTRDWSGRRNQGIVNVKIWVGVTDTLDNLDQIFDPKKHFSEEEMLSAATILGLEVKKSSDNNYIISKSY
ncbi:matrix [Piry virus]|uniref:Matrix protein n=1 Tax=Piry virus TaxID=11274 RepID=A0A1I9L1X0_PIRYV|nr:matrix [Piry virus]AMR98949.1 matrix [Piry virus]